MRIDAPAYQVVLTRPQGVGTQSPAASAVQGSAPASRTRSVDRVDISPAARELTRLKQSLAAIPEVRLDRVALAKQNLQQGGRVDSTSVAQSMIGSFNLRNVTGDGA